MITEQQQEQAALCALGALDPEEQRSFAAQARSNPELRQLLASMQQALDKIMLAGPASTPPPALKAKVLARIQSQAPSLSTPVQPVQQQSAPARPGLRFLAGSETAGWKELPIRGAWIKLLSFEPSRGYAVLLGKLEPGVRYPAHANAGPEDFYILTGDLQVGEKTLRAGDFHHADAGSLHGENYSVQGCTLLAVLTVDDPLVSFVMG
jgi:anti-sigma factor ChrR (cupin superfamily)